MDLLDLSDEIWCNFFSFFPNGKMVSVASTAIVAADPISHNFFLPHFLVPLTSSLLSEIALSSIPVITECTQKSKSSI